MRGGGIERAVSKYEDDGLVALSRAVARRVGRRAQRLQRNVRWHLEHPRTAAPDPGRVYAVSPSDVEYLLEQNALRDRIGGQVRCDVLAGDWALLTTPLRETYIYDSLRARFVEGTAWESTTYYRKIAESDGEPYAWNGQILGEVEDPLTRLERYDALYADVNENGSDGSHPVEVHIGRNGKYIRHDGAHRLVVARLCDVDRIPVPVRLRHAAWQGLRDAVASGEKTDVRGHPDLASLS